ncbi:SAM-dependent methyltransferase [Aliikangiella sp. G2MR2-5]|uniref:SAM-dependent methyltransferase n=1 Tax=Aliikangiella sp. G2MR2-5 TaxID=2788943 RepID=UPI0018A9A8AE|nr:SAM-dependent methyltransferase [Aliikangiella sp. G2MR2-5]
MTNTTEGSLVCVGTGIQIGAQLTPVARRCIEEADVVFMSVSTHIMEEWVSSMNSDVRNLQSYYEKGLPRNKTYKSMVDVVVHEVECGKKVCLALYGHPGMFAIVAHKAIEKTREIGFKARMEPGISAEDCLIADLGLDPGTCGIQQFEATQFMLYQRLIDPSAYLLLWQIGVAGDLTLTSRTPNKKSLSILLELLFEIYPESHQVVLYEARTTPLTQSRVEYLSLNELSKAQLHDYTTLVIPPCEVMKKNTDIEKRLKLIFT